MATKEKINLLEVIPCRNEHIKAEQEGTNGKTNCSIFKKHFVPGLPLLTQNKMCILLQKIEATYSVASIFALNLRKRSMVG